MVPLIILMHIHFCCCPAEVVESCIDWGHKEVLRIKGEHQHLRQTGCPSLPCLLSPLRIWISTATKIRIILLPCQPATLTTNILPKHGWRIRHGLVCMLFRQMHPVLMILFRRWWCKSTLFLRLSWGDQRGTCCSWSHSDSTHWVRSAPCSSYSNTSLKQLTSTVHTFSDQRK